MMGVDTCGGIFSRNGLNVTNSTVSENSTGAGGGGGIFHYFGPLTVNDSNISGNSTFGSSADGAGVYTINANATVTINGPIFELGLSASSLHGVEARA